MEPFFLMHTLQQHKNCMKNNRGSIFKFLMPSNVLSRRNLLFLVLTQPYGHFLYVRQAVVKFCVCFICLLCEATSNPFFSPLAPFRLFARWSRGLDQVRILKHEYTRIRMIAVISFINCAEFFPFLTLNEY